MKLFGLEIRKVSNDTSRIPLGNVNPNTFYFSPRLSVGELLANTTVSSCVSLIADSVAILSCNVYEKTDNGRTRRDDIPLAKLLRRAPNYDDTAFTFKQTIMTHLLLKGNAFIFIERNPDYSPRALYALDPDTVQIKRDDEGEVYYVYTCKGISYKYNTSCILHIPAMRYNSLRGLSPMEYATHAAKTGLELDEYTANYFDGGINSKLVVTVPQEARNWTKEDSAELSQRLLSAYGGKENAHKPLILSKGLTAQPLNVTANADSQLVENRAFSEREIAKIFRVPLFMLGKDDAKFTNMEQANTFFLQQTLTPWLVRLQEYLDRLLTYPWADKCYVEFDTNTLLRADYNARWNNYRENFKNGIFTLNQIYDMENLQRVDSEYGDKHFMQLNMSTMDQIAKGVNTDEGENNEDKQDNR